MSPGTLQTALCPRRRGRGHRGEARGCDPAAPVAGCAEVVVSVVVAKEGVRVRVREGREAGY